MNRLLSPYFDLAYFIRFSVLLVGVYYFHVGFNGIISPEGEHYSAFLDHYFNYIAGIRNVILNGSNLILHQQGIPSYIEGSQVIMLAHGPGVNVWFPCLGLGIISFWIAFVVAHEQNWKIKLAWCLAGLILITLINCIRIAILLLSLHKNWREFVGLNHHDLFNLACYICIFFLICFYNKNNQKFGNYKISPAL